MFDGVGHGQYEIGEIRLHMGDLAGAETAFNRAYEHGVVPQPGLALLMLARGKVDEAARALERSLIEHWRRARRSTCCPGHGYCRPRWRWPWPGTMSTPPAAPPRSWSDSPRSTERPAFEAMARTGSGSWSLARGRS